MYDLIIQLNKLQGDFAHKIETEIIMRGERLSYKTTLRKFKERIE